MKAGFKDILISKIMLLGYCVLVLIIAFFLLKAHYPDWWKAQQLCNWDCGYYSSIRENGYTFKPNQACNTAFFPLFPYFWRWIHLGEWGISVVNMLIFSGSMLLLFRHFPSSIKTKALSLSCTLLLFYFVPYSESLFFLFATLMLIGLKKEKAWIILLGITGMGFTRSNGIILFPAFMIVALACFIENRNVVKAIKYLFYGVYSLLIMIATFAIQYYQTGVWMAFSKSQRFWDSYFRVPDFPLSTWDISTPNNKFIDQFALFIGILSLIYIIILFVRVKAKHRKSIDIPTWISFIYFSEILLLLLFTRGGMFVSINRYMLSVPFLYLFILEIRRVKLTVKTLTGIAILSIIYMLICWHMGTTISRLIMILPLAVTIFLFPYLLKKQTLIAKAGSVLFILFTAYVQAALLVKFITNAWVG